MAPTVSIVPRMFFLLLQLKKDLKSIKFSVFSNIVFLWKENLNIVQVIQPGWLLFSLKYTHSIKRDKLENTCKACFSKWWWWWWGVCVCVWTGLNRYTNSVSWLANNCENISNTFFFSHSFLAISFLKHYCAIVL